MNIRQLQKNVGQQLRLRPIPHRLEDDGRHLPPKDDPWRVDALLDHPDRVRLENVRTGHVIELQPDNIREYRSPDFLVLRCQLSLAAREVRVEPLVPAARPVGVPEDTWTRLENLMPGLLEEMRADLAASPQRREFVVLKRAWVYWAKGNELVYYLDDHPELEGQIQTLLNLDLVGDISSGNVSRYLIRESLAQYLGA